jgi:hypothetical protein
MVPHTHHTTADRNRSWLHWGIQKPPTRASVAGAYSNACHHGLRCRSGVHSGRSMCPVFLRRPCSLSFALERVASRQQRAIAMRIAVFTRANTATHAANRAGSARISKETKRDAICENHGERPFNQPLQPRRSSRRILPLQPGRHPLQARLTPANNSLAASTGMSGSMTPLAPRRRIQGRESGHTARTQTQMLIRPGGRRRDTHGERAASRATRVIAA